MNREHLVYRLSSDQTLVEGYKRSAIYDLARGYVYSVNKEAQDILLGVVTPDEKAERMLMRNCIKVSENPELVVRPEITKRNLDFAWLEVEDKCNMKCLHCYGRFAPHVDTTKPKMTFSDWTRVIDELSLVRCNSIQFIGGEPLMMKRVFDLGLYAKKKGIENIEVFTNGTLVTDRIMKEIKELGFSVATSFYSADEKVHDEITQTPGSYKKTMKFIDRLVYGGISFRVGLVIMKQNETGMEETLSLLQEMGVSKIGIDVVRPSGRGSDEGILPDEEIQREVSYRIKPNFQTSRSDFAQNMVYNQCSSGKIAITSNGEVIPCIFDRDLVVGNVFNSSIENVLQSKELGSVWTITKDQVLVCKDCEYRYACHDCRPLAESAYLERMGPNPRCTYNPYVGEWNKGVWSMIKGQLKFDKFK